MSDILNRKIVENMTTKNTQIKGKIIPFAKIVDIDNAITCKARKETVRER